MELAQSVLRVVALANRLSPAVEHYIEALMGLPGPERKLISHYGALRCRPGDRIDHIDPDTGVGYFDPTNWTYSFGFKIVFPRLSREYDWNRETQGDICEILLAMGFSRGAERRQYALAVWLEEVMYACYTILTIRPDWLGQCPLSVVGLEHVPHT